MIKVDIMKILYVVRTLSVSVNRHWDDFFAFRREKLMSLPQAWPDEEQEVSMESPIRS